MRATRGGARQSASRVSSSAGSSSQSSPGIRIRLPSDESIGQVRRRAARHPEREQPASPRRCGRPAPARPGRVHVAPDRVRHGAAPSRAGGHRRARPDRAPTRPSRRSTSAGLPRARRSTRSPSARIAATSASVQRPRPIQSVQQLVVLPAPGAVRLDHDVELVIHACRTRSRCAGRAPGGSRTTQASDALRASPEHPHGMHLVGPLELEDAVTAPAFLAAPGMSAAEASPPSGKRERADPSAHVQHEQVVGVGDDDHRPAEPRACRARRSRRTIWLARSPAVRSVSPMSDPALSVVVTLLNEEGSVEELYRRTVAALDGRPFELILVDDGSTDGTWAAVERLHTADPRVHAVRFKRNFGQHPAMHAGLVARPRRDRRDDGRRPAEPAGGHPAPRRGGRRPAPTSRAGGAPRATTRGAGRCPRA